MFRGSPLLHPSVPYSRCAATEPFTGMTPSTERSAGVRQWRCVISYFIVALVPAWSLSGKPRHPKTNDSAHLHGAAQVSSCDAFILKKQIFPCLYFTSEDFFFNAYSRRTLFMIIDLSRGGKFRTVWETCIKVPVVYFIPRSISTSLSHNWGKINRETNKTKLQMRLNLELS